MDKESYIEIDFLFSEIFVNVRVVSIWIIWFLECIIRVIISLIFRIVIMVF